MEPKHGLPDSTNEQQTPNNMKPATQNTDTDTPNPAHRPSQDMRNVESIRKFAFYVFFILALAIAWIWILAAHDPRFFAAAPYLDRPRMLYILSGKKEKIERHPLCLRHWLTFRASLPRRHLLDAI